MKVVEKFTSINGEGTRAGELAVFIRFKGCNLRCSYCDTMWANEPECPYKEETPEEILNYVLGTGIHNVTLTGGEPLLQKDIRDLIHLLLQAGLQVEIETNGAVDLAAFCEERPVFTMDYKLPSSGCEEHMITENMELLEKDDTVKFVYVCRTSKSTCISCVSARLMYRLPLCSFVSKLFLAALKLKK